THDAAGVERLYINGVEQASQRGAGDFRSWDAGYRLALANVLGTNRSWLGSYHHLAISSRALSAAQVGAHYQAGAEGSGTASPSTNVGLFVQQVVVNGGTDVTTSREITLDVSVQVPTEQSLDQLAVAEYGFDPQRNVWKLLQRGIPTSTAAGGYRWTLKPGAGARYLQVWATDRAGTTSSYPYQTFINLIPASVDLEHRHTDVYRFGLSAGEAFSAQVAVLHGDADLYVWGPAGDSSMRWVSNGEGSSEAVSFTTPVNGVYQVEVHGYSHASYQLSVTHGAAAPQAVGTAALAMNMLAVLAADKALPEAPAVSVDSAPALDSAGDTLVYLPLVRR
ncbi:MAG: hypothetical protein HGA65_10140, partial [Oscillochloris sp.]|nr:hypothetical protein [Oscillochloris sp.]